MGNYLFVPLKLVAWLLLAGWLQIASAASGPGFYFDACANCSDAMFAATAELAAPFPDGNYPVYVIDIASGEVRFFLVSVWTEDRPPGTQPLSTIRGSGGTIQHAGRHTRATQGAGDPEIIKALQDALITVELFAQEASGRIQATELGLPQVGIDSAVDLVGPEGSASLNRRVLRNQLNDFYKNIWDNFSFKLNDVVTRLAVKYFLSSDAGLVKGNSVHIMFPDGTEIEVKIKSANTDSESGELSLELEVKTETARGPGLPAVPQVPSELPGFTYPNPNEGGPSGDFNTADSLADLARRLGSIVNDNSGGGGGGSCSFACDVDSCTVTCKVE